MPETAASLSESVVRVPKMVIREGDEYIYTAALPRGCAGHIYRMIKFVKNVQTNQQMVLVQALTGPDIGLMFVCTESNFANRYKSVPNEEKEQEITIAEGDEIIPEKTAGYITQGSGA